MAAPKPLKKYPCTQAELYAISEIGWNSFTENLADFTPFKSYYDAAYAIDSKAEVAAAKALPDDQARNAVAESLRIELQQVADAAILKWKTLRSHIGSSFPVEQIKPKEEAAGYAYYDSATHYDWEDISVMLTAGKTFITDNTATLTTGGMPAAFAAAYDTAMNAFTAKYNDFIAAEQDAEEGTTEKILANNAIFDKLMPMFADGQIIYTNDAAKRNRFIFAKIKELVAPPGGVTLGSVTISGKVTDSATTADLPGALVSILLPDETEPIETTTNATGDYTFEFNDLPEGDEADVTITVSKAGYQGTTEIVHIVVSSVNQRDYSLAPEA